MFNKLRLRWRVNNWQLLFIILTFALGGSLCGFTGKKIMALTGLERTGWWILIYIVLITLLWPVCVLLLSIPLGQFRFFRNYIGRIFKRFSK